MQKIKTRTDLLAHIARLKAENRQLQEALDEIAEIVNDEGSEGLESEGYEQEDLEEEDAD